MAGWHGTALIYSGSDPWWAAPKSSTRQGTKALPLLSTSPPGFHQKRHFQRQHHKTGTTHVLPAGRTLTCIFSSRSKDDQPSPWQFSTPWTTNGNRRKAGAAALPATHRKQHRRLRSHLTLQIVAFPLPRSYLGAVEQ